MENRRTLRGMKVETIRNGVPTDSPFQGFEHGDLATIRLTDGPNRTPAFEFTCLIDTNPIDEKTQEWINAMEDRCMEDRMDEFYGDPALPRGWNIDEMSGW
jgi:hypothetical protein